MHYFCFQFEMLADDYDYWWPWDFPLVLAILLNIHNNHYIQTEWINWWLTFKKNIEKWIINQNFDSNNKNKILTIFNMVFWTSLQIFNVETLKSKFLWQNVHFCYFLKPYIHFDKHKYPYRSVCGYISRTPATCKQLRSLQSWMFLWRDWY